MIDINHIRFQHVDLVTASGRINNATYSELTTTLQTLVDKGRLNIALELSGIVKMDSSGLRVFVAMLKATRPRGGDLRLVKPSERVLERLRISGLVAVFKVYSTIQEAVDSFIEVSAG
jgi:anti-sigma B factor antagonist